MVHFATDSKLRVSLFSLSLFCLALLHNSTANGLDQNVGFMRLKGNFCSKFPVHAGGCCPNRQDECAVDVRTPEGDTKCYCDDFCDRRDNDIPDCCSDFYSYCRGEGTIALPLPTTTSTRPPAPPTTQGLSQILGCYEGDNFYPLDVQVQRNCHICACVPVVFDDEESFEFHCDTKMCLLQESDIRFINDNPGAFPWKASNYSFFWGLTLDEGIRYRLGTFRPDEDVVRMTNIRMPYLTSPLPEWFDARVRWPGLIHPVRDQGNCAASWAFSTTALAADRIAIMSQSERNFSLSPQHLISCSSNPQKGCSGGSIDRAWVKFRIKGVVAEECYPFEGASGVGKCFTWTPNGISKCPNGTSTERRLYRTEPPYRIASKEDDIMYEIMTHGPVQAVFHVYPDFFMYRTGIYRTALRDGATGKAMPPNPLAYHSVRIIGWGIDESYAQPIKYWICANSWGTQWGEDGTFRIIRGENESQIESFVVGVVGRGYRITASASPHIPAAPQIPDREEHQYNSAPGLGVSALQTTTNSFQNEKVAVTESPLYAAIRNSANAITESSTTLKTTDSGDTSTKSFWLGPDWNF